MLVVEMMSPWLGAAESTEGERYLFYQVITITVLLQGLRAYRPLPPLLTAGARDSGCVPSADFFITAAIYVKEKQAAGNLVSGHSDSPFRGIAWGATAVESVSASTYRGPSCCSLPNWAVRCQFARLACHRLLVQPCRVEGQVDFVTSETDSAMY